MQHEQEATHNSLAEAMTVLGRIGAVVCHERGPKTDTALLTTLASNPAEGFWQAIACLNARCPSATINRCALLMAKRHEIARLARALPHPLPANVPACEQAPFWAGY